MPIRIAVPIDRAERLEGFGCIRLGLVSVVDFTTAWRFSDCVQRVYRALAKALLRKPAMAARSPLSYENCDWHGQPRVMRKQSCGFEIFIPVLRPGGLAIGGKRRAEFVRGVDQSVRSVSAEFVLSRTRMTDFDGVRNSTHRTI